MLHPCCAAAAKKKSRKKKRLSFRKGDDVLILTEKSGDEKSDEILSDALLKLDDVIRHAKPEKKVRTPDSENLKKLEEGASRNPTRSKSRDSKNCCKHFESSRSHKNNEKKCSATSEKVSDPKISKKSKNQISTSMTNDNNVNDDKVNDDEDSLIGSHFIPDHVKSLIPERV